MWRREEGVYFTHTHEKGSLDHGVLIGRLLNDIVRIPGDGFKKIS